MEFKDKLKKIRIEKGLTQETLADNIHVSRSAIAKYENGNGKPSEETLKSLALFFGISTNELEDDDITGNKSKHHMRFLVTLSIVGGLLVTLSLLTVFLFYNAKFLTSGINLYSRFVLIFFVIIIVLAVILVGILICSLIKGYCKKPHLIISFSSAVASLTICFSGYFVISALYNEFTDFTVEKWANASNNHDYRGAMIDSFIEKYDINGYGLEEVEALLGKPDDIAVITLETYPTQYGGQYYIYDLGFYEDYIDPTFFKIVFNYNNTVVSYSKIPHWL